jgi:hypothetical protein
MPYRKTPFYSGGYYHIYNRGHNRKRIFFERENYIYLNPVRAGLANAPADWEFSSYQDYIGLRKDTLVHPGIVMDQFDQRSYREYIEYYQKEEKKKLE